MPKDVAGDTLYTLDEVAEALGLPSSTLRLYARDGRIKARKIGKAWHVTEAALKSFLQSDKSNQIELPKSLLPAGGADLRLREPGLQMARERGRPHQTWHDVESPAPATPRHLANIGAIGLGISLANGTVFLHLSSDSAERLNGAILNGTAKLSFPDGRSLMNMNLSGNGTLTSKDCWEYTLPVMTVGKIPRGTRISLSVLGRIVGVLQDLIGIE